MAQIGTRAFGRAAAKPALILSILLPLLFAQASCSDVRTLAWNKAEETINGHKVVIKPCRNSYTKAEIDTRTETDRYYVLGCGDEIQVEIRNETLTVNGKSYGTLQNGDSVEVKDGKVFINAKEAAEVAKR